VLALDNIDVTKNRNYIINGLPDHDAQIIKLNNFDTQETSMNIL
jgi:hypothetical protein